MPKTRGFTLVEFIVVVLIAALLIAVALPAMKRALESRRRAACQGNLKQLGLVLYMYNNENDNVFPPVHGDQTFGSAANAIGCDPASFQDRPAFAPRIDLIYPKYLNNLDVLICPAGGDDAGDNPLGVVADNGSGMCKYVGAVTRGDASYMYLGYRLDKVDRSDPRVNTPIDAPAQLAAIATAMNKVLFNRDRSDDAVLDGDILLKDIEGANPKAATRNSMAIHKDARICRLSNEINDILYPADAFTEVLFATSQIPIVWDRVQSAPSGHMVSSHRGGCNTLYMDGHVEFTRTGEGFPLIPGMRLFDDSRDEASR